MADLGVDSAALRYSGGGVRNTAEDMSQRLAAFQSELASYGQPWGNDDLGSLIGMAYETVLDVAMDCITENLGGLAEDGAGLVGMADSYDAVEQENVAGSQAFDGRLG
ncbi:hypothetical protein Ais01nite_41580 [Asanoa ishikariensis]|uniref:Excreted virulence factor EspC, type VII ESX diderm n=1 Tax=Asanoa ishikariensis TaxID=137265 RepID=A0A1H3MIC8_9ACTN|nr:hypothetical protein [Asanoa ishikariensis]GIF66123.1 hypothetical protein Ais01nite_41580 [Asanoa ishikariensis]SDY75835.1 hypothetical protein SAMN05421684_1397 [Asanoa ishikariensis]